MPIDLSNMNLEERAKYLQMKETYKERLKPWYKRWWGVIILIVISLILIFGTAAGLYIWNQIKVLKAEEAYNQELSGNKALQNAIYGPGTNYYLGTDNNVLTIVEFSDFACPFCAKAHSVIKKIEKRYPGQVKIIYRDLPIHDNSINLALAARCAGEQGYFWQMHDKLFENQDSLTVSGDELETIIYGLASTIGLDAVTYDQCYQNKKYLNNISIDYADAANLKLKGTPSWFINGKLLSGYLPDEDFLSLLDNYIYTIK